MNKKKIDCINSRKDNVTYEHLPRSEKRTWDELEDLYTKHFNHVMQIADIIKYSSDNQELVNVIINKEEFSILLNGFKKELNNIIITLFEIHAEHEGKTGPINNGSELRISLSINEKYVCLGEIITSNFFDISNSITNILDEGYIILSTNNIDKTENSTIN